MDLICHFLILTLKYLDDNKSYVKKGGTMAYSPLIKPGHRIAITNPPEE